LVVRNSDASSPYRTWVGRVDRLARLRTAPDGEQMKLPPAESLLAATCSSSPQLARPFLIVAVGGIAPAERALQPPAGGPWTAHINATRTGIRCAAFRGVSPRHDLAGVFPIRAPAVDQRE
jgi:hypothetical protein